MWLQTGFELVNSFLDRLQVLTTNIYNTITTSTLYSSLEHIVWCSQSATRRFPVTASTVLFLCLLLKSSLHRLQYRTACASTCPLLITSRHGPHTKQLIYCGSVCCCGNVYWAPETALVYPLMSRSLHSKGSIRYIMFSCRVGAGVLPMFQRYILPPTSELPTTTGVTTQDRIRIPLFASIG
jgi:hypothetical protein